MGQINTKINKSYPQAGLGIILCVVYNGNQVGKSGKSVNNFLFRKLMNEVNIIFFTPVK
jgi:pullulanase/glycogen debranching enzyme